MRSRNAILAAVVVALGSVAMANPVTVDKSNLTPNGTTTFSTIQSAINSWCVGGTNAGATEPFVINIVPSTGPYEEQLTLDSAKTGNGNIVGDLVIQSSVPSTLVEVRLQLGIGLAANDDGLWIYQEAHDVTFNDLLFTPSRTAPIIGDELVKIDENSANATMNTITFNRCVFTDCDGTGVPVIGDGNGTIANARLEALTVAPVTSGSAASSGDYLLQAFGDNGESCNLVANNCVLYGNYGVNTAGFQGIQLATDGSASEVHTINNCVVAHSRFHAINLNATAGVGKAGTFNITGTDAGAGVNSATVLLSPKQEGSGITVQTNLAAGATINVNNVIIDTGAAGARGLLINTQSVNLADSIIKSDSAGIEWSGAVAGASTINRTTFASLDATDGEAIKVAGGTGSITVADTIFAGPGTKIGGTTAPTGGINVNFSAYVESGADTITGRGTIQTNGANIANGDPSFQTTTLQVSPSDTSADFYDVTGAGYAAAGTAGAALAGGADFEAGVADWNLR